MLHDYGFNLIFSEIPDKRILDCPCVFVIDLVTDPLNLPEADESIFRSLREHSVKVIYFDNADSCGTPCFQVMPYVDLYLRRQVYKDKSQYLKEFTGNRVYTHFYHEKAGIPESHVEKRCPLRIEDMGKIITGWNCGFGDYKLTNRFLRRYNYEMFRRMSFNQFHPRRDIADIFLPSVIIPWQKRPFDVHYRAGKSFVVDTISYGREKADQLLETLGERYPYVFIRKGSVSRSRFKKELARSKIVLSPFGYGEICHRDFEAFLNGCVLVKPDMQHLDTWPAYYEPNVTYVPYFWDFRDFKDKIRDILESGKGTEIAMTARKRYLESISTAGGDRFCRRFKQLVGML
jgi:hypothetical protein